MKIGFIGCGNMAGAIIKGIIKEDISPVNIYAYDINSEKVLSFSKLTGINISQSAEELVSSCQIIIMSVKPNLMKSALEQIKDRLDLNVHIVASIAAGISINTITEFIGIDNFPVVRIMPNINISVSLGMACVCRNNYVGNESYEYISSLFSKTGKVLELEEKFFPLFGALAGSSPAFTYLYIDSLAKAAHKAGLSKDTALEIASQAVLGSAAMLMQSKEHPWKLIDSVCSPGGTTIEGICSLEQSGFQNAVVKCLDACMAKDAIISEKNKS